MEPLKIVIIEDEEAHFQLMRRAIVKEFPRASVYYFSEAGVCADKLCEIQPDIVIVDYLMPGMNGIEFLERFNQENQDKKPIPVIMITGQGDENVAVTAMKLGAWDYLVKSADFFTLLPSVIGKVLRERGLQESLQASARMNELLLDSLPHPAMLVRRDHVILTANRAAQEMGARVGDYCWRSFCHGDYLPERDRRYVGEHDGEPPPGGTHCAFCKTDQALSENRPLSALEVEVFGRLWDTWWIPVGRDTCFHYALDVTERKKTEEALRRERDFAASLIETAQAIILVLDREGRIVRFNPYMEERSGYRLEEVQGKDWFATFIPEGYRDRIRRIFLRAIDDIRIHGQSNPILIKDGTLREIEWYSKTLKNAEGETIGLLAIGQDITKRMRAERALRDQLHFLQTLIDTIPNPIFYKDVNGLYIGCNRAFEARLGMRREDIIGKSSYEIFPKKYADKYHQMDTESFKHPGEQVFETSILYGDGKKYDVIIYKGTFTNADGTLAGLVGVAMDITERKQAEDALRRAHDELELRVAERTAELARTNEELRIEISERRRAEQALRESSEKLKLFAYSVAHDLKSPVVGIYGLTQLLRKNYWERLDEKGREYCEQILRSSENVAALVEKINAYAATKEAPLLVENVNVKEILRIVRDEFSAKLSLRQITWNEPSVLPELKADRLSLLRVFRNLVDNALKYGGDQLSEIRIEYEETPQFHIYKVSDNGVGIEGEDAEKIFGAFQRNGTSRGIEGTGLGLAIVKEAAEQHRGKVWVESAPQGGTTFHISISKFL